jgi:hypothetical protein
MTTLLWVFLIGTVFQDPKSSMSFSASEEAFLFSFYSGEKKVGSLFVRNDSLVFIGTADESAKMFMDELHKRHYFVVDSLKHELGLQRRILSLLETMREQEKSKLLKQIDDCENK